MKIIWVGDSTSDSRRIRFVKRNPAAALYEEFESQFLEKGKPLNGATYKIFARDGATTRQFLENKVTRSMFNGVDDIIKYCNKVKSQKKIIVYSLGHNDGITMKNWKDVVLPQHTKLIDRLLSETNAFIILRMPNAWLYVEGHSTKENMNNMTESLYSLYMELAKIYYDRRCTMVNIQDILGWKNEYIAKQLMSDWTHPNEEGYRKIARVIGDTIVKLISSNKAAI